MKVLLLVIIAALPLLSCLDRNIYGNYSYHSSLIKDDYKGFTIRKMDALDLPILKSTRGNNTIGSYIYLSGNNPIYLTYKYFGNAWMFIPDGSSMIFIADSQKIELSGDGSMGSREVGSYGAVTEYANYLITKEQFKQIIKAKELKLKVYGNKFNQDFQILPTYVSSNFSLFYYDFVDKL